jgi:hypothetical protein
MLSRHGGAHFCQVPGHHRHLCAASFLSAGSLQLRAVAFDNLRRCPDWTYDQRTLSRAVPNGLVGLEQDMLIYTRRRDFE